MGRNARFKGETGQKEGPKLELLSIFREIGVSNSNLTPES